ncbi:hypothetical protein ACWEOO_02390 [Kribbella sp. NPDC004138]
MAAIIAAAALVTAGSTNTAEAVTTGTPSGPPPYGDLGLWCVSTTGATACFHEYGDRVWVKDTKANGDSAAGTIQGPGWARRCFNDRGADAGWVLCDFDVPENNSGLLWAVNNPFVGNSASTEIWTTMI